MSDSKKRIKSKAQWARLEQLYKRGHLSETQWTMLCHGVDHAKLPERIDDVKEDSDSAPPPNGRIHVDKPPGGAHPAHKPWQKH